MAYTNYPAVDENNQFPPVVREAIAASQEIQALLPAKIIVDPANENAWPNGTVFLYTTA